MKKIVVLTRANDMVESLSAGIDWNSLGLSPNFLQHMEGADFCNLDGLVLDARCLGAQHISLIEQQLEQDHAFFVLFLGEVKALTALHPLEQHWNASALPWPGSVLEVEYHLRELSQNKVYLSPQRIMELWEDNKHIVHERFWFDVLTGKYYNYDFSTLQQIAAVRDVVLERDGPYVIVLLFIVRNLSITDGIPFNSRLFALHNLMTDTVLQGDRSIPIVTLQDNLFGVVRRLRGQESVADVERECMRFRGVFQQHFHRSTLCALSAAMEPEEIVNEAIQLRRQILDMARQHQEQGSLSRIQDIRDYISKNLDHPLSRNAIAQVFSLNPDYLSRVFKKETGMLISDYIEEQRIVMARGLLANTELSVSQVALRVGYSNFSYFSRIFRQKTGLTPTQFRRVKPMEN